MPASRSLCVALVLAFATLVSHASAQDSESVVAPGYPNSELSISVPDGARAGSIIKVTIRGSNALFDPDEPTASPSYSVDAFVMARSVIPKCPRTYSAMLDNQINLGSDVVLQIVRSRNAGQEGRFKITQRYRAGSVRRVVYCAYTRLITDDVAVSALRPTLRRAK